MKFTLLFKSPETFEQLPEILGIEIDKHGETSNEADQELYTDACDVVRKYVRYSEYIEVEFDTETRTATVLSKGA